MFYKEENTGWLAGLIVNLPTGEVLNEDNKLELDGWKWSDEEPEEYTEWLITQDIDEIQQ